MSPARRTADGPNGCSRRLDAICAIAGLLIGGLIILVTLLGDVRTYIEPANYLVSTFDHPTSVIDRQLVQGDGQVYAELARDPSLARPQLFDGGDTEAAYRAQRPLYADLAWLLSFGQPGAVGVALIAVNLVACASAAFLLSRIGRAWPAAAWWFGPLLLLLPGSLAAIKGSATEVVALTFLAAGLWTWLERPWALLVPAVFFALAGLTCESSLLLPAGLALAILVGGSARTDWRRLLAVLLTPIPWLGWITFVRLRIGAWPFAARDGRLGYPFAGLVHGAQGWWVGDWLAAALLVVACGIGLWQPSREFRCIVAVYMAMAIVMGSLVWATWQGFARVLLPLYAFGLLAPSALPSPEVGVASDGRLDSDSRLPPDTRLRKE